MDYLSLTEVLLLHARIVQLVGGAGGVRDFRLLESAIARPQATFSETDLYPALWDKAAALMESLIQNHPFVDGNKRTGLVATGIFLERNGCQLAANSDQVFEFTMSVARGEARHQDIARWLEDNREKLAEISSS
jgi:death-on-curing protein